jgi:hypothetical protein
MGRLLRNVGAALLFALGSIIPTGNAQADDLVASVLPLSRSPVVGQTATTFATVINASGQDLAGCTVTLSGFPGAFAFQTTDPATNALTGAQNEPFSLTASGPGSLQTLVLFLQASTALPPTDQLFVFGCAGSSPAASIIGLDTLLLSASTSPQPDIVALASTLSGDGVVRMTGVGVTQAFAVSSVNVGSVGSITVTADTGDIQLPLQVQICQTDPTDGACLAPPSSSVSATFAANQSSTFSVFTTATAAIPFFPSDVRLFLRFKDGGGTTRGSTSVALTSTPALAAGQTAGGFYLGVYRVTSGPFLGLFGPAGVLIAEDGEMAGITEDPATDAISSLFTGQALPTTSLQYASSGTVFAAVGYTLPSGLTVSPLTVNGAVSPRNFVAGLYSLQDETGEYYVSYDASIYEQPSAISLVSGAWTIRDLSGDAAGSLTVTSNGSFSGTDVLGCGYNGTISIINASYNAYHVALNVSNCGEINGAYSGLSYLFTSYNPNDSLRFELSSSFAIEINAITRF